MSYSVVKRGIAGAKRAFTGAATAAAPLLCALMMLVFAPLSASAAAPTITSFTPTSGPVGTYVTLTGTNLSGVTSVQFGSVVAPGFSVNSEGTSLVTKVPVGATTNHIYVLSPSGNAASPGNFTVTAGALPSLSPSRGSANEGSAAVPGAYEFKVTLSAPSSETVTVSYYTTDNTAKAGSDYLAVSGTLTFAPGVTTKTVKVTFIGDSTAEAHESFYLDLRSPVNATLASSRGVAYIRNDDGPGITIDNALTVNEGNGGTTPQTFAVRLSAASTETVTVKWATANGTAGPSDYTGAYGTLTFAPGETTKTITVLVKGDTTVEPSENYRVNLSSPTFAVLADSQGVAYIRNDDGTALPLQDNGEPSQ